ncbi:hypothetical protein [Pseudogracilibacillus sp. SO30301A]|uniref:hypothetical protein n=1 Tax=Pseudogracilibacillus sp. SO30301A TaxID=3098291 RepID=UPI00300E3573
MDWKKLSELMRQGHKGVNWSTFIKKVRAGVEVVTVKKVVKVTDTNYLTSNNNVMLHEKVTLRHSATHYATGERIPERYKGKTYTVMQRGSNRVLLKELYSWVHIRDVEKTVVANSAQYRKTIKMGSK